MKQTNGWTFACVIAVVWGLGIMLEMLIDAGVFQ